MKFKRITLDNGCRAWSYVNGEHTFRIEPRHNPHNPDGRGYVVFHTGPRPELTSLRERDNVPLDDDDLQLTKHPISTIKAVKKQMELLLIAMAQHANN